MMNYEEKVWGSVAHLFANRHAAVSLLRVNQGYRCSKHMHNERVNLFHVVTGEVAIDEWDAQSECRSIILNAGQTYVVDVHTYHQFRVIQSGEMVEVYWPAGVDDQVRLDDIVRVDEGGKVL